MVRNNHLPRLFDEIAERGEYTNRVAEVAQFNATSRTHLRGIACTAVKFGISFNTKFLNQANALVNVYLDGSVQVSTGATEMGQGVNTKIRQIVADEFGIDAERVLLMPTSTEKNNNTSATAASSGADLNGSAAADACRKIRARMAGVAAEYFERAAGVEPSVDDIVFENGEVFDRRNPEQRVPFAALVKMCHLERVSVGERGFYSTQGLDWDADKGCGAPFLYFTQGTAISEVEIDRFTGMMQRPPQRPADGHRQADQSRHRPRPDHRRVHPGHGLADERGAAPRRERQPALALADDVQDPEHPGRAAGLQRRLDRRRESAQHPLAAKPSASRRWCWRSRVWMAVKNALSFLSERRDPEAARAGDRRRDPDADDGVPPRRRGADAREVAAPQRNIYRGMKTR